MVAAVGKTPGLEVVGFVTSFAMFVVLGGVGTDEVVLLSALGADVLM